MAGCRPRLAVAVAVSHRRSSPIAVRSHPQTAIAPDPAVEPNPYFTSDLLRYVEDKLPVQSPSQNRYEARCYEQMFLHARRLPADLLRRAATTRIKFAQMFGEDRARYRGALVHVEGRLRTAAAVRAARPAQGLDAGLSRHVRGVDIRRGIRREPVLRRFQRNVRRAEARRDDRIECVETDAFFFKRYRYSAKDGSRDAPFLIAKEIRAIAPAAGRTASRSGTCRLRRLPACSA